MMTAFALSFLFMFISVYYSVVKDNDADAPGIAYAANTENYTFVTKWGNQGTGDGQFNKPTDIAIDPSSNDIYVVDSQNHRVQVFDSTGKNITPPWGSGSQGTGDGQFSSPSGIAIDPSSRNVYVFDSGNSRIEKFTSDGTFLTSWSVGSGVLSGSTYLPDISIDTGGHVYFTQTLNNTFEIHSVDGSLIAKTGSSGLREGQFDNPTSIAVDGSNNVYVFDAFNHRIQKFDGNGNTIKFIAKWGSHGTGEKQFRGQASIAIDSIGNVYVADTGSHRVQKFDSSGNFLTQFGSKGGGNGQLNNPLGIAVDESGNVYVADTGNHRIVVFAKSNQPPIANAGTGQTVNAGDIVTLDGSKSTDPNNDPITYSWRQISGTPVTLDSANTAVVTFTAPEDISKDAVLRFELNVTDAKNSSNDAFVAVTVTHIPLPPPKSSSPPPVNIDSSKIIFNDKGVAYVTGVALYNLGKYAEAIQYFDKALAVDPNYKLALNDKGNALYRLGEYAEAIQSYDKALAVDPNYKLALNGKGFALGYFGEYDKAILYFDKALAVDPNYKLALYNKGVALSRLGEYDKAILYFDKALAVDPNYKLALNGKGVALSSLGEYDKAILYLTRHWPLIRMTN